MLLNGSITARLCQPRRTPSGRARKLSARGIPKRVGFYRGVERGAIAIALEEPKLGDSTLIDLSQPTIDLVVLVTSTGPLSKKQPPELSSAPAADMFNHAPL